ncbi:TonB-dependent receptor plug domain-containing protein [Mucilaginibacter lacusdianchii]|uniref:TonB-dependent receptor plug domain-containing protein n=1 Tax=Mucilaginibacter lacusdianchii TaxID=2684211 RepID=UPI00131D0637|nr:TonB-dependent receptor plug domain-containing protein [Mucilaginibacter sp. JXJ CY 39]
MLHNYFVSVIGMAGLSTIALNSFAQAGKVKDTLKAVILSEVTVSEKTSPGISNARKISRKDLELFQSNTLGETLSHIPGVQNGYFGPNSGAPMIRSMTGNRVKILSNGLSLNDLSGISPNLNVMTDMDNLSGIDVYKSGASILYGGKAIGGAVNLRDNTIPSARFAQKLSGFAGTEATTNNGYKQAFDLNGNMGKKWVWHLGGMNRWNKDIKIPGNTKAPIAYDPKIDDLTQTMAQVNVDKEVIRNLSLYPYLNQFVLDNMNNPAWGLSEADLYTFQNTSVIDGQVVSNPRNDKYISGQDPNTPLSTTIIKGIYDYSPVTKGIMPNSHAESRFLNFGTTYLGENFYAGIGYRGAYGYYGIPGFALSQLPGHTHSDGHTHNVPGERVYRPINTRSQSSSLLFETGLHSPMQGISFLKLNYMMQLADDTELSGEYLANNFGTKRHVVRAEVEQQPLSFLKGLSGVDFSSVNMSGTGKQRYFPDNHSRDYGAFTLQHLQLSIVQADLGYRHDVAERRATPGGSYKPSRGLAGGKLSARDFHLNHFNSALQVDVLKIGFIKGSYVHAERAPDVNELYAGNNHYAIMLEENGDDRLNKETSKTLDLGAGFNYCGIHAVVTRYKTVFHNYLYLAHTGISRSGGFLVKEWRQSNTEITGWEAELAYKSLIGKQGSWELGSYFDLVKNKNTSDDHLRQWAEGDYMPNLPTSRYGFSGAVRWKRTEVNILFDRYLQQRYLGKNINPEPPMPAYSLLGARIAYKSKIKGYGLEYYLSGNNLLNVEARPQNSILKYLAPLPGRNLALGIRLTI